MDICSERWEIAAISEPGSVTRLNEDAWLVWETNDLLIVAVFDGVTQILAFPALAELAGAALTPGRFAAMTARDVCMARIVRDPTTPLLDLFRYANEAIQEAVIANYGSLTVAAVVAREPTLAPWLADARAIRLALPAAVATIARVDRRAGTVEWLHLGDTALIPLAEPYKQVTYAAHQGSMLDDLAYRNMLTLPVDRAIIHPSLHHLDDAELRRQVAGRFGHNAVDLFGQPQRARGMGVLDGLDAMESFARAGVFAIKSCDGFLICSDGFLWLAPTFIGAGDMSDITNATMSALKQRTLGDYITVQRAEVAHRTHDNPIKLHDDATGILVRW